MNLKIIPLALAMAELAINLSVIQTANAAWQLAWTDEFNGSVIDTKHWKFDVGTGPPYPGWGRNELEYYTSRLQNAYVSNGVLHIVARHEAYNGSSYTSAKLNSLGRFSHTYGRFEFSAKLPEGQGYWPALWMMPRDSVYGGWAASGETDVMENNGNDPSTVSGTIHFGGQWPDQDQSYGPAFTFPPGDSVTNFHVYALEWTTNEIRWYVDYQPHQTQNYWWSSGAYPAPFDQPFFFIMNLAVGGNFVGNPGVSTIFPGEMQVDYVRVYDWVVVPLQLNIALTSSNALLASWPFMSTSYVLQQNFDLTTTNWTDVTNSPVLNLTNLQNQVTVSPTNNAGFYRLKH